NNLAESAQHRHILERMRKEHRKWMARSYDIGLLPEGQMHIQAEGSTPYEIARDPGKYSQKRILEAAELVNKGRAVLPKLIELLEDSDAGVRYWAAVAISALGDEAGPAKKALTKALTDENPVVRFTAAGALCKLGLCESALPVLAGGLEDRRETVVLHAAREIQGIGNKARPITEQIKKAQAGCKNPDDTYKNNNHAMFIDWALKYALQNCRQ
ncbi:MAG: HEAT repeat domain-containing protein, partial [Phycisphaerae bacterium]|nr:HEAT repeat domain-containing protein [Phycisphaerae bacterium]